MKYEYHYSTIAANLLYDQDKEQAENIIEMLGDGWEIYSAVSVQGGVHYILRRESK